jgi:hypothetical protein
MRLVENIREAWRWFSVQAFAIIIALPFVWPVLPADVRAWMPKEWEPYAFVIIAFCGLAGRLVDQKKKDGAA